MFQKIKEDKKIMDIDHIKNIKDINHFEQIEDITIIGGGVAGLNLARILREYNSLDNYSISIYTMPQGATGLWAGTIDVIKSSKQKKQLNQITDLINHFILKNPYHPYGKINILDIIASLKNFEESFDCIRFFHPDIVSNIKESNVKSYDCKEININKYINKDVLTLLGLRKSAAGIWNSLFTLDKLENSSVYFLVEFREFTNSTMALIRKAFIERERIIPSQCIILPISLLEIFFESFPDLFKKTKDLNYNWTVQGIARILDKYDSLSKEIGKKIIRKIIDSNHSYKMILNSNKIKQLYFLFQPVLGLKNTSKIISNIEKSISNVLYITTPNDKIDDNNKQYHNISQEIYKSNQFHKRIIVQELISFSPSVIGQRFLMELKKSILNNKVELNNRFSLVDVDIVNIQDDQSIYNDSLMIELNFSSGFGKNKKIDRILTKALIFAVGNLFLDGIFEDEVLLSVKLKMLQEYTKTKKIFFDSTGSFLYIANKLLNPYKLNSALDNTSNISNTSNTSNTSNIHYFSKEFALSENLEIDSGAGLGLSIITSYNTAKKVLRFFN